MGDKKQLLVNMVASLVNFAVSVGIGLVLTPYIVRSIGAEAYGFVGLANTFVSYAQLLTIALNSVAGRFITVAYHEGDDSKANGYYSSTLAGKRRHGRRAGGRRSSGGDVPRQAGEHLSTSCGRREGSVRLYIPEFHAFDHRYGVFRRHVCEEQAVSEQYRESCVFSGACGRHGRAFRDSAAKGLLRGLGRMLGNGGDDADESLVYAQIASRHFLRQEIGIVDEHS